ncbi:uncharacterized protein [Euphorbia lathyris]|uniref:uncharacterized protein isoform X2 n=1 Tax=Euphorbia lathyris TaxID=212925 RepID=UPI003314230F
MENFVNPCDKEYMRMAILKHEETFKHQVHELHRLYRIQKLLMRNIGKERPNPQLQSKDQNNISYAHKSIKKLDLERPADEEYAAETDESEIELTLGPSNYNRRRKKLETPLTSDSGATFSSSSTGSSHNRNNTNTCFSLNTKREEEESNNGHELGLFQDRYVCSGLLLNVKKASCIKNEV